MMGMREESSLCWTLVAVMATSVAAAGCTGSGSVTSGPNGQTTPPGAGPGTSTGGTGTGNQGTGNQGTGNQGTGNQGTGSGSISQEIIDGRTVCDEMTVEAEVVPPPDVLLVVDKSGSMDDPVADATSPKKISVAVEALDELVTGSGSGIRFGWLQFPGGSSGCTAGTVRVGFDEPQDRVEAALQGLSAAGGTPTGPSLANALGAFDLQDTSRSHFVILLTDGMATCPTGSGYQENDADQKLAVEELGRLHAAGIDAFVIGLGEAVNSAANIPALNEMAEAGGRPRQDPDVKYYPANSLDELTNVFDAIGVAVMSCVYELDVVPMDPDTLWVYLDGTRIQRDPTHTDGFDYTPATNRIEIHGPACEPLRDGSVSKVDIKMACEPPV